MKKKCVLKKEGASKERHTDDNTVRVIIIPVEKLVISELNVRKSLDDSKIDSLAESIKKEGLLQYPIVRPNGNGNFEAVVGQIRVLAGKKAGLTHIPCIPKELSDSDAILISLIENLERGDLNPIDRAKACKKLMEIHGSQKAVAKRLRRDESTISAWLSILDLEPEVQDAIRGGVAARQFTEGIKKGRDIGLSYAQAKELGRRFGDDKNRQKDVAKAIEGITDDETQQVFDILDRNPTMPAEDAVRLILSQKTVRICCDLPFWISEVLRSVAEGRSENVKLLVPQIVEEWLREKGLLEEVQA